MKTHLILSGGGVDGFQALGALKYMQQRDLFRDVSHIIGVSVGSLLGLALLCVPDLDVIQEIFIESNSKSVPTFNVKHLLYNCSLFEQNHYVSELIKYVKKGFEQENITFRDLFEKTQKTFTVVGANISTGKPEYFSVHNTPDMNIETAITISCAIPFVFPFVKHNNCVYIDGCFFEHFPVNYALACDNVTPNNIIGVNICRNLDVPACTENLTFTAYASLLMSMVWSKHAKPYNDEVLEKNILCLSDTKTNQYLFLPIQKQVIVDMIESGYMKCEAFFNASKDISHEM